MVRFVVIQLALSFRFSFYSSFLHWFASLAEASLFLTLFDSEIIAIVDQSSCIFNIKGPKILDGYHAESVRQTMQLWATYRGDQNLMPITYVFPFDILLSWIAYAQLFFQVIHGYLDTKQLNCTQFNTRNYTYTMRWFRFIFSSNDYAFRARRNGTIQDIDSFGCSNDSSYYYTVKGERCSVIHIEVTN